MQATATSGGGKCIHPLLQPLEPFADPLAVNCRGHEDFYAGIDFRHICTKRSNMEIGIWQYVGLIKNYSPCPGEKHRILGRLVITLRSADHRKFEGLSEIELRGADQVTHILDKKQVKMIKIKVLQSLPDTV